MYKPGENVFSMLSVGGTLKILSVLEQYFKFQVFFLFLGC